MTNETIEKIIDILDVNSRNPHLYDIAEAIYEQIVEPLEKEIEQRRDMMQRMNCNYVTEIYKSEELQHKVKVLERALSHLAHDFNGQQFYIYAQSDTDEETYEKFIQRAEKELKENETD